MNRKTSLVHKVSLTSTIIIFLIFPEFGFSQELKVFPLKRINTFDTLSFILDLSELQENHSTDNDTEQFFTLKIADYSVLKVIVNEGGWHGERVWFGEQIGSEIVLTKNEHHQNSFEGQFDRPIHQVFNIRNGDFLSSVNFVVYNSEEQEILQKTIFLNETLIDTSEYSALTVSSQAIHTNLSEIASELNALRVREIDDYFDLESRDREKEVSNIVMDDFNGDGIQDAFVSFEGLPWYLRYRPELTRDLANKWYKTHFAVLLGQKNTEYEIFFTHTQDFSTNTEGNKIIAVDLDGDHDVDIVYDPDVYHGFDENRPDSYYDEDGNPWGHAPTYLFINDGFGNFHKDSLTGTYDGTRPVLITEFGDSNRVHLGTDLKFINLDSDQSLELVDKAAGDYVTIWDFQNTNDYQISTLIYVKDVIGVDFIDINGDQKLDLIFHQYEEDISTTTVGAALSEPDGLEYSDELIELIKFVTPHQAYEGSFTSFNIEGEDYLSFWLIQTDDAPITLPQSETRIYRFDEFNLTNITHELLPDSLGMDMVGGVSPPGFIDLDNDGFIDFHKNGNLSFKGNNSTPIHAFVFNNSRKLFEPNSFTNTLSTISNTYKFIDIDADGIHELWFKNYEVSGETTYNDFRRVSYKNLRPQIINISVIEISEDFKAGDQLTNVSDYYDQEFNYSFYGTPIDQLYSINSEGEIFFAYPRSSGLYQGAHSLLIDVEKKGSISVQPIEVQFVNGVDPLKVPELTSPFNEQTNVGIHIEFHWSAIDSIVSYHFQLSTDETFSSLSFEQADIDSNAFSLNQTLDTNSQYYWRVKSLGDVEDRHSEWSATFSFTTGVRTSADEERFLPKEFVLEQNYPNPFNPTTQIRFSLPKTTDVKLQVFNILGQPVSTLMDGRLSAGQHAVNFDGAALSSGVYLYTLKTPEFTQTRVMNLLK